MLERLFNLIENGDFGICMPMLGGFGLDFETNGLMNAFNFDEKEHFVLKDGVYEFSMNVDKNANADNVKIDLDKNNVLKIKYSTKTSVAERIVMVSESLPEDADADTVDAKIVGGKLIVTANRKYLLS